jgi:hypothetical protein
MDDDSEADACTEANMSAISNVSVNNARLYIHSSTCFSPRSHVLWTLPREWELHCKTSLFTDDNSLYGIGNRIFDVYIQVTKLFSHDTWEMTPELYIHTCLLIITCDEVASLMFVCDQHKIQGYKKPFLAESKPKVELQ